MFSYDPIGKTLEEVAKDCEVNLSGYAVFVLRHEEDTTGEPLDESISIRLILLQHPEYKDYVVKYTNDFYGMTVLRVIKEV